MRVSRGGEWINSRSAAIPMGKNGRSVKPSAQPPQVRTLHLSPPAETARGLRVLRLAGCCFWAGRGPAESMRVRLGPAVHGHIDDMHRAGPGQPPGEPLVSRCRWSSGGSPADLPAGGMIIE